MLSLSSLLLITHLIGLALAVGAATLKLALLVKCKRDLAFVPVYVRAVKPITRQIILGLILLTLSGIGWLIVGYPFTARLIAKLVLVALIWVIGPIIDNVVEPQFLKLIPAPGEPSSPAFGQVHSRYLAVEAFATLLFYAVILVWLA